MKKLMERFESPTEFWFMLVGLIVALLFFIGSFKFTGLPRLYPRLTSFAAMVFAVIFFAKRLFRKPEGQAASEKTETESEKVKVTGAEGWKKILITLGFFIAFVIFSWLFGFLISSIFMVLLYPLVMGYRKPLPILGSLVLNVAIVLGFQKLVGLTLTRGLLLDLTRFFF